MNKFRLPNTLLKYQKFIKKKGEKKKIQINNSLNMKLP